MVERVHDDKGEAIKPEDFKVATTKVLEEALKAARDGQVHTVAVVHIGSGGEVVLASSVGTPQTLNLLAQGIKVADGTYDAADD